MLSVSANELVQAMLHSKTERGRDLPTLSWDFCPPNKSNVSVTRLQYKTSLLKFFKISSFKHIILDLVHIFY